MCLPRGAGIDPTLTPNDPDERRTRLRHLVRAGPLAPAERCGGPRRGALLPECWRGGRGRHRGDAVSSIKVTLPDNSTRELPAGSTAKELAAAIGPGLAKAALAARVNGQIRDLGRELEDGANI